MSIIHVIALFAMGFGCGVLFEQLSAAADRQRRWDEIER